MEIHSYDPVEVAIQKSITPETTSPKTHRVFLWGVIVTLLVGGIVYWIRNKNKNSRTENHLKEFSNHSA